MKRIPPYIGTHLSAKTLPICFTVGTRVRSKRNAPYYCPYTDKFPDVGVLPRL